MYGLSPAIAILDITMGKLSKFKPQVPLPTFSGWKAKVSSDGETSHSEREKEKYVGPYDNSLVPRVTIHSFIMGVFVRLLSPFSDIFIVLIPHLSRFPWEVLYLVMIQDKSLDFW